MFGKKRQFLLIIVLLSLLCLLNYPLLPQPRVAAVTVWSDNFNDGDYGGWTLAQGSCDASNNYLETTGTYSLVYRTSAVVTGTWSFDLYEPGDGFVGAEFISLEVGSPDAPNNGYYLSNWHGPLSYRLAVYDSYVRSIMIQELEDILLPGWIHFDVTRNSTGHFEMYMDGVHLGSDQDTTHTTSTYFVFHGREGARIDNIVVSNSIDIQPPTTPPGTGTTPTDTGTLPGIPGFPLAAIGLGIIISMGTLILVRRRRQ